MLGIQPGRDEHEKFKKLCALAASGTLAPLELAELQAHLHTCDECGEAFRQHQLLATRGVAHLIERCSGPVEQSDWDNEPTRNRLLKRVEADRRGAAEPAGHVIGGNVADFGPAAGQWRASHSLLALALAACLLMAVGWGAYRLGAQSHIPSSASLASIATPAASAPSDKILTALSSAKMDAEQALTTQARKLDQLQIENSQKAQEVAKLKADLQALQQRSDAAQSASSQSESQLLAITRERDDLTAKLRAANQTFADEQGELAGLKLERDKNAVRVSSLEAQINELVAANRDQERRLKDTEQYLTSDRDIRELMGARKLYIADVFDVDGTSRTQKPFGRVFYTQGRSLIFYAFDLDHEPGVVNASTFQVWGQREKPQGEQASPMNLGILYMDNESNRRWVMRFDDPKKLAEIDAVFVTVEPRGGSHKPTSKPFLYALLRNEANHP
jgi:hypothetical protein